MSIRTLQWKYIEPSNGVAHMKLTDIETGNLPKDQLYDMKQGGETENIAEEHPDIVEKLKGTLKAEREK